MPEKPNTSSPGSEGEGTPAESVVSQQIEEPPKPSGWNPFQSILGEQASTESANEEQETSEEETEPREPVETTESESDAFRVYKTQEEHDRAIQAEVDRREANRKKKERAAERARLRETDPLEFARKDAEWEAEEQTEEEIGRRGQEVAKMVKTIASNFDNQVIDPLVDALPEGKRSEILSKAPPQMEGRNFIVKEAIKAIRADAEAAAEAKLRKNSAFRKELLRELQDGEDSPELLPATPVPNASKSNDMNDLILGSYFGRR
jgi:flagellar basal body-associated protein FliL